MFRVLLHLVGEGDTAALGAFGVAGDAGGQPDEAAFLAGELVGCWHGDLLSSYQ